MGHAMGDVRTCPGCGSDHAVGTTCGGGITLELVVLTAEEQERSVADARSWEAGNVGGRMKFQPPPGWDNVSVKAHGIGAERAAARATGLVRNERVYRAGERRPKVKNADLGQRVEVRAPLRAGGAIRVEKNDPAGRYVLGVNGRLERGYLMAGWIRVEEAKRPAWLADDGERWMVPQHALHPMPLPEDA